MPSPVTPSPHRFMRRCRSPEERPQQSASFQHKGQISNEVSHRPETHLSQFAPTPRFATGKRSLRRKSDQPPTPPRSTLVQSLRASRRPVEDVEDASAASEDDRMIDIQHHPHPRPRSSHDEDPEVHFTQDLPLSPKRRRLDGEVDWETAMKSNLKTSPASFSFSSNSHSTLAETSTTISVPESDSNATSTRPVFLKPTRSALQPSEPLPETFSPHRKGQKFLPGGMAATVQQWVIETGQAAVQSRRAQGGYAKGGGEEYVLTFSVDEIIGGGPFSVTGKTPNGESVGVLLASGSSALYGRSEDISKGSVVGIRAPIWDVDLQGAKWKVGVDWKLLS